MKPLIILILANLFAAMLVAASMVAADMEWSVVDSAGVLALTVFGGLAFVNLGYILFAWNKRRRRAFLPLASYLVSAGLAALVMHYGTKFVWWNTPFQPDTFLTGQRRADLTAAAMALDGKGYSGIADAGLNIVALDIIMLDGHPRRKVDQQVINTMKRYGLVEAVMDDAQGIVRFLFCNNRLNCEYIWSKPDLTISNGLSSTIFDEQVGWNTLTEIIRHFQGGESTNRPPETSRVRADFPFPQLKAMLGDDLVIRLAAIGPEQPVGEPERKAVLAALNRQRMPASRLLENPIVTYENWGMHGFKQEALCLNGNQYQGGSDDFYGVWEVNQVKKVMDAGLVTYAADGRHLKIKEGLSPQQSYEVEWAQVGIMSLAYGEVLSKRQFPKLKALGDHWYYFCW